MRGLKAAGGGRGRRGAVVPAHAGIKGRGMQEAGVESRGTRTCGD